ncbi:MAG: hypothetical protein Q7T82_06165 [Armatimonadota bacterium]|nr:hypothetical protein [Armatimonadota bacterium]
MRTIRTRVLVASVCLAVLAPCAGDASSLTSAQAASRAARFFESVGWKPNGKVSVSGPSVGNRGEEYRVSAGDLLLSIDMRSGSITYASSGRGYTKPKTSISAAKALDQAKRYAKAAGLSLAGRKADVVQPSQVVFRRYYRGHPFMDDTITMMIYSGDGSLKSLNSGKACPLPASTLANINKRDSERNCRRILTGQRLQLGRVLSQRLMIVQPNNYWGGSWLAKRGEEQGFSKLAWVIRFERLPGGGHFAEGWVDAANGRVIGGVQCK